MIRQYGAQTSMGGYNPLRVGTVPTGAVLYLLDDDWWRARFRPTPVLREPWIVEGFLNGTIGASRRNRETGMWETTYAANRSDMAVVRSLRSGRRKQVAVRVVALHLEEGYGKGDYRYPDRPDMSLYRRSHERPSAPKAA